LQVGFLSAFWAPIMPIKEAVYAPSMVVLLLLRLCLFKLVLMSGSAKLEDGDEAWANFSALEYHFATQSLPTPVAWYFQNLPAGVLQFGVAFALFVEVPCSFLVLSPFRAVRHAVGCLQVRIRLRIRACKQTKYAS